MAIIRYYYLGTASQLQYRMIYSSAVILVMWAKISGASYVRPTLPVSWYGLLATASVKRSKCDICLITLITKYSIIHKFLLNVILDQVYHSEIVSEYS